MKRPRLYIRRGCRHLIQEIPNYVYQPMRRKASGNKVTPNKRQEKK